MFVADPQALAILPRGNEVTSVVLAEAFSRGGFLPQQAVIIKSENFLAFLKKLTSSLTIKSPKVWPFTLSVKICALLTEWELLTREVGHDTHTRTHNVIS